MDQARVDTHQEGNVLRPGGFGSALVAPQQAGDIGQLPHGHQQLWPHVGWGAFKGGVCAQPEQASPVLMQPRSPVARGLGVPALSPLFGPVLWPSLLSASSGCWTPPPCHYRTCSTTWPQVPRGLTAASAGSLGTQGSRCHLSPVTFNSVSWRLGWAAENKHLMAFAVHS